MGVIDDPHFYDREIAILERKIQRAGAHEDLTVFYGSSSFRLWEDMAMDLHPMPVLNLAFGGSSFEWCIYHYPRLFTGLPLRQLVLYAGDNDLGNGLPVDEMFTRFLRLIQLIRAQYKTVPVHVVSIKPSVSRDYLLPRIREANAQMKAFSQREPNLEFIDVYGAMMGRDHNPSTRFFTSDQLHMNRKGYRVWRDVFRKHFQLDE